MKPAESGRIKNMITCRECGAPIEELAERCPYCGAINGLGAEHKYMQDMYDLKDDLKEVGYPQRRDQSRSKV